MPADSLGPWLLWAAHFLTTHGSAAAAYTCFKSEGHGFVLTSQCLSEALACAQSGQLLGPPTASEQGEPGVLGPGAEIPGGPEAVPGHTDHQPHLFFFNYSFLSTRLPAPLGV